MSHNWYIREAKIDDAGALGQCMTAAYCIYQDRMGGVVLPPAKADYQVEIDQYPCWVIEIGNAIAGGLIMEFGDKAKLANIAVSPLFQGQGMGGALMRFAQDQARARGYDEIHLATHVLLEENISLYQYLGWEVTARDDIRIQMRKLL